MNKSSIIKTIEKLSAHASVDEIIEKIILMDKIEEGLKNADEGKVYSTKEAKKKLKKWLK